MGEDPKRPRSEAAFAHLCCAVLIPTSSGKVVRCSLNCLGNRAANRALHLADRRASERMSRDERTQAYMRRRSAECKSKRETMTQNELP